MTTLLQVATLINSFFSILLLIVLIVLLVKLLKVVKFAKKGMREVQDILEDFKELAHMGKLRAEAIIESLDKIVVTLQATRDGLKTGVVSFIRKFRK
jgi:hypothetical protein